MEFTLEMEKQYLKISLSYWNNTKQTIKIDKAYYNN